MLEIRNTEQKVISFHEHTAAKALSYHHSDQTGYMKKFMLH